MKKKIFCHLHDMTARLLGFTSRLKLADVLVSVALNTQVTTKACHQRLAGVQAQTLTL